jgi:hypothetical protein
MMKLAEHLGRVGGIFDVIDDTSAWMFEIGDVVGRPVDGDCVAGARVVVVVVHYFIHYFYLL